MTKLILLALAVAACSTTATIADGTCGNYVLDPGEDCDQPGGDCTATCQIVCDPTMRGDTCGSTIDGVCCPNGFTCGVDDVCHAPSGSLSTVGIAQPFDAAQFRVADLDGDLVDDVLGVSSSAVSAIYGDPISPLTNPNTQSSPFSTGPIAIGDYDGDQRPDVVIPTAAGLYALETSSGVPQPVAFPAFVSTTAVSLRVATLGAKRAVDLAFDLGKKNAVLSADGATPVTLCDLDGIQFDNIAGRSLTADTESVNSQATPLIVPLEIDTSAGIVVCIQTPPSLLTVPSYEYIASTMLSGGNRLTPDPFGSMAIPSYGETFFAHLDNDPSQCPDLAVPVIDNSGAPPFGGGLDATVVIPGHANAVGLGCTLSPTVPASKALEVAGVPLASITITHSGKTFSALVTESGIYDVDVSAGTNVITPVVPATRSWRYAIVADLDGNGLQDLVTVGAAADVEVIFQEPAMPAINGDSQWIDRRISTTGAVSLVTAGDYDGDGIIDLAFAVVDPSDSRSGAIAVSWGGPDGFADPQISVTLDEFFSMTTAQIPDPSLPDGFVDPDDLIIAHGALGAITSPYPVDMNDPAQLTYIYGSSTRLLSSPFRVEDSATVRGYPGVLAAIGNYGQGGALGVLGAFNVDPKGTPTYNAEQLGPQAYGDFTQTNGVTFEVCSQQAACVQSAYVFNVPLGSPLGNGGELLLALRGDHVYGGKKSPSGTDVGADQPSCAGYYLATSSSTPTWALVRCHDLIGDPQGAQDITMAPWNSVYELGSSKVISNDGTTAVIVLSKLNQGKAYEAVLWNLTMVNGAPLLSSPVNLSTDLVTSLGLLSANCWDATSIELGEYTDASGTVYGADGPDMVVACRAPSTLSGTGFSMQLFERFTNANGVAYVPAIDTGEDTTVELHAGDLNGDGLDDIVYTVGSAQQGTIHLFTQCDSHGAGCDRSAGAR